MAEDITTIGRRFYGLINEGRTDELLDLVHPDYVGHGLGAGGRDSVKQDIDSMRKGFPDLHIDIEDTITEGDRVVLRGHMRGTHDGHFAGVPATGRVVEVGSCDVLRVCDGQVVEAWTVCDSGTLFMQIGAFGTPATTS
jgi:steroid delta-isomerase-like uncharacterized protein